MKKILYALKDHFLHGFRWPFFIFLISYLIIALIVNYTIDLENGIIDKHYGKNIRIFYYFLLYGGAYYPVAIVYAIIYKNPMILRKGFWIKSFIALLIISFDRSFHYHSYFIREMLDPPYGYYLRTFFQFKSVFTITLPVLILHFVYRERNFKLYGLTTNNFDWRPYAWMLGIMVPLITIASFEPGFSNYYPKFKLSGIPDFLPMGWAVFIYESIYGLDFLSVELMFRGFLVLGMMQFLGKGAVYPMIAVYCFFHFGKPWGEAVSSIIGGYILGVISLYTRTIFGGVLIHIGIAWMMELAAAIQKYVISSG